MNAVAEASGLTAEQRIQQFKDCGSVFVGDMAIEDVIEMVKHLAIPTDELRVENERLMRDDALTLTAACPITREKVAEVDGMTCRFCGQSIVRHRSSRDGVRIGVTSS